MSARSVKSFLSSSVQVKKKRAKRPKRPSKRRITRKPKSEESKNTQDGSEQQFARHSRRIDQLIDNQNNGNHADL